MQPALGLAPITTAPSVIPPFSDSGGRVPIKGTQNSIENMQTTQRSFALTESQAFEATTEGALRKLLTRAGYPQDSEKTQETNRHRARTPPTRLKKSSNHKSFKRAKERCDKGGAPTKPGCIQAMTKVYRSGTESDKAQAKAFLKKDIEEDLHTATKIKEEWRKNVESLHEIRAFKPRHDCPKRVPDDSHHTAALPFWATRACRNYKGVHGHTPFDKDQVTLTSDGLFKAKRDTFSDNIPDSDWDHGQEDKECVSNPWFDCILGYSELARRYEIECLGARRPKDDKNFMC